jgi:predicted transposase/invertase (TIGR01784 family)
MAMHNREPLLDPKNDLVFKWFLQDELEFLKSLIAAVLDLPGPIEEIEVLNPDLPGAFPADKRVVLDIRIKVAGLGRFNIEMQRANPRATCERFLFYWAKEYVASLQRGQDYAALVPVISILWLDYILDPHTPYHSIFRLSELTTGTLFSSHLCIHTLELPKYRAGTERPALARWSRFFRGPHKARALLAKEDKLFEKAMRKLRTLSDDDILREHARDRERDEQYFGMLLATERQEGVALGRQEGVALGRQEGVALGRQEGVALGRQEGVALGRQEGVALGKQAFLLNLIAQRFGPLPEHVRQAIESASTARLEHIATHLLTASSINELLNIAKR